MKCLRVRHPKHVIIVSIATGSALLVGQAALAAKWTITPRIESEVSYTDNVDLDNQGKEGDVVLQLNPSLAIKADGNRLKFQADYDGSFLHFVNDGRSQWRNHLRSKLNVELIEDHLYITGTGIMAEPFVDNTESVTFSDSNYSINRRQTQSYTFEPYFKHKLFDIADMQWTYRFRYVGVSKPKADDPTPRVIDNYVSNTGRVTADSGDRLGRFHWTVEGEFDSRDRGDGRHSTEAYGRVDAEYRFVRWLGLTGSAGYQKIQDPDLDARDQVNGGTWTTGLRFNPSRTTDVSVWYGKQDGDNSLGAKAEYKRKRWKVGFSYLHEITTTQRRFADINEDGTFNDSDFFVSNFGTILNPDDIVFGVENDTFRSDRFEFNFAYDHRLTSFDAHAYYETRIFDTTGREVHEYDIKTRLSQKLSHRMRAVLQLRNRRTDFDIGPSRVDNFYGARAELHYEFSRYLDAELAYIFSMLNSNQSINNQTENVVQLSMRASF